MEFKNFCFICRKEISVSDVDISSVIKFICTQCKNQIRKDCN